MFCRGSGVRVPSACCSYSMNTRFQNSRNRSQREQAGAQSGSPQPCSVAPVPVDLGVGAARPGAADGPEVLDGRKRNDPLDRHPDLLPELDRDLVRPELHLGIARVDGHPHAVPVELHVLLDELARELDRALLEVLPEREVAEHLEERQVVAVEPHLVDVDRPEAFLRQSSSAAPAAARAPRKYGICGCIPAVVSRSVESSPARGTSEAEGQRRCPRSSKNERKPSRSSAVVRMTRFYEGLPASPGCARPTTRRRRADPGAAASGRRCGAPRRARSLAWRPRPWRHPSPRRRPVARGRRRSRARRRREAADLLHRRRDRRRHRADGGVGAVRHRHGAVGHRVELVELVVHPVDGAARLDHDRQEVSLRALDQRRQPPERATEADEHVRQREAARDEEHDERVVQRVASRRSQERHGA